MPYRPRSIKVQEEAKKEDSFESVTERFNSSRHDSIHENKFNIVARKHSPV